MLFAPEPEPVWQQWHFMTVLTVIVLCLITLSMACIIGHQKRDDNRTDARSQAKINSNNDYVTIPLNSRTEAISNGESLQGARNIIHINIRSPDHPDNDYITILP